MNVKVKILFKNFFLLFFLSVYLTKAGAEHKEYDFVLAT